MVEDTPLKLKKYPPGQHPNSRKNLIPYPPGVSGNEGSGNGYSLTAQLKHSLDRPRITPDKGAPARDHIVHAAIEGAIEREPTPFKEVWDRVEGKVIDRTDHTFNGEGLSEVLAKLRGYKHLKESNGQ